MEKKIEVEINNAAAARREQLLHIVQDGKIQPADRSAIRDLLREPEMLEKIQYVSELLFGRLRSDGQAVDLNNKSIVNISREAIINEQ